MKNLSLCVDGKGSVVRVLRRSAAPQSREALLRPLVVGICGTDRQMLNGQRDRGTDILGHECVAEVVQVKHPEFINLLGKRVVINPVNPRAPGKVVGHSMEGCLQERYIAPESVLGYGGLIEVSDTMPLTTAVLAEPLAAVLYGIELVERVVDLRRILILGAGAIAMLTAAVVKLKGIDHVQLVYRRRSRFDWAVSRGILSTHEGCHVTSLASDARPDSCNLFDASFICTTRRSAKQMLGLALSHTRSGGAVDLVSAVGCREPNHRYLNAVRAKNCCGEPSEGFYGTLRKPASSETVSVTGHRGTSLKHMKIALQLLEKYPNVFSQVISHEVPLAEAPRILNQIAHAQRSGPELVKVIVGIQSSTSIGRN